MPPLIRKARLHDVKAIHQILMGCAAEGLLLPRSFTQLYSHLRDFFVLDEGGEVVGCSALSIIWEELAEVRSLAIRPEWRGKGLGRDLVEACTAEARDLGVARLFALTYQVPFFERLGFEQVSKDILPQKVWTDCVHCPNYPDCNEVAVLKLL